jgi:hypothetical protein
MGSPYGRSSVGRWFFCEASADLRFATALLDPEFFDLFMRLRFHPYVYTVRFAMFDLLGSGS